MHPTTQLGNNTDVDLPACSALLSRFFVPCEKLLHEADEFTFVAVHLTDASREMQYEFAEYLSQIFKK
jgi:hypothetical protein